MMKPRIHYDSLYDHWLCEILASPDLGIGTPEHFAWLESPVGAGSSPKEAFLDWYNQMVEQHIDE